MVETDLLIVGAGAAGLSSARGASEAGLRSVIVADAAERVGGILPQCLHSGFGTALYGVPLSGPEFLGRLLEGSTQPGLKVPEIRLRTAVTEIRPDRTAVLLSPGGPEEVRFRRLILASGCRERNIRSIPMAGTRPAGVMSAGLAQQLVNLYGVRPRGRVVILGGGDIGLVMAGRFAELGVKPLAVIDEADKPGGMARNLNLYVEANRIPVICGATVCELHGSPRLTGITIRHLATGRTEYMECDLLVTALGLIPDRSLLENIGAWTENGLPEWADLAGNCDFVHEIVDRVVREGERIGRAAAEALLAE